MAKTTTPTKAPSVLVDTDWVAEHLRGPQVRYLEVDEDLLLYATGHLPGAQQLDSLRDLWDPVVRDFISPEGFAALLSHLGITRHTTVVLYGDKSNWWATYAFWFFRYNGHPDVRLIDGGRQKLINEGFEFTEDVPSFAPADYPVGQRDESKRAYRDQVRHHLLSVHQGTGALIDVRSTEEYRGLVTHMPEYPQEGVLRGGHIPGATHIPWARAVNPDGTFKALEKLRALYESCGITSEKQVVTYCRIAERSSHTWFVLAELLGYPKVQNYDGSWTEWGNAVGMPIERS